MLVSVSKAQARVPVTVLQPHGDVDGSNYRELISQGQAAIRAGAQYMVVDLSDVPFISSAGLVALHTIARQLQGQITTDEATGWDAVHDVHRAAGTGTVECLKLCSVQKDVQRTLTLAGVNQLYGIYPDREAALAAF